MIRANQGRIKPTWVALLVIATFIWSFSTANVFAARVIEAEGSAYINNGAQNLAKENAIKNAMKQALLQTKAHINSTSTTSSSVLIIDSARINTSGTVEDVKVLDEWVKNEIFYVRIQAHIPDVKESTAPKASPYRKKIAAIQFDVLHRNQIYDLKDIEFELPRELLRRLDNTGDYVTFDATQYLVSSKHPGMIFDDPAAYKTLGDATGAQFILSGQIRDMQVIDGFFSDKRQLEIEIYIHDALSGARIARHRFSETVANASYLKPGETLSLNVGVNKSVYGNVLNRVLDSQIGLIAADLLHIPFSATVIQVKGQQVYFDAGSSSLINSGDVLTAYRLEPDALLSNNKRYLGIIETPVASLSVQQVQPQFSIGKLEIDNSKLMPGDVVRFGQ